MTATLTKPKPQAKPPSRLKAVEPTLIEKRLKILVFGAPNVGKTRLLISCPTPYVIDTERGAENPEYVKKMKEVGASYMFSSSIEEITEQVKALAEEDHDFKTLGIDPLTIPYNLECDNYADKKITDEDDTGTAFGRNKVIPDRKMKRLINLINLLDMNVVITAHEKAKYVKNAPAFAQDGYTFDCYSKMAYAFDLVLRAEYRGGDNYVATVEKTRLEGFPKGSTFPFNYQEFEKRVGRESLERKSKVIVFSTDKQIKELKRLCELLNVTEDKQDEWLKKANVSKFEDMPSDLIQKCIAWCNQRIDQTKKGEGDNA